MKISKKTNLRIYFTTFLGAILFVIMGAIIARTYLGPGGSSHSSRTVSKVGEFNITQQMVDDRNQLIRLRAPKETRDLGLTQLEQAYMEAQILINNGHPVTQEVIEREAERIDKATLMPEKLQEIKNIFGSRKDDYFKVFVLPTYVQRVIYYEFFLNDPRVQSDSYQHAIDFLKQAAAVPVKWSTLARAAGLQTGRAKVSLSGGFEFLSDAAEAKNESENHPALIDQSPKGAEQVHVQKQLEAAQGTTATEEGRRWIQDLLSAAAPGQVINKVINSGEVGWLVVKFVGVKFAEPSHKLNNEYELEYALVPKCDYAQWHEAEKNKVQIVR